MAKTSTKAPTKTAKAAAKVAPAKAATAKAATAKAKTAKATTAKAVEKPSAKAAAPARKTKIATKATPEVDTETEDAAARPTRARRSSDALVIVESPAKAKTIKKYLGAGYVVKASVGHVKDLPKKKMGIDIEHGFQPEYVVIDGKKKVLAEIMEAARHAQRVLLAPDPDREGEAIAWHIAEEVRSANPNIQRVLFNEITKKAINEAIGKPMELDIRKFESQQARRVLDRLVGYQISPVLWTKVRRGLSAGRVQSVAVRLVVEREAEITAFKPEEYWTVETVVEGGAPPPFTAKFSKLDGKRVELTNEGSAREVVDIIKSASLVVAERRAQGAAQEPAAAVHHLEAAAGGLEQAALLAQADDGALAAALRRCRGRRRRPGRSHHLYAYRLGPHLGRRHRRGARVHRRALRRHVPARRADRLQEQEGGAGRARGDPADLRSSTIRRRSAPPGPAAKAAGATSARATISCGSTRSSGTASSPARWCRRSSIRRRSTSAPAGSSCGPAVR